MRFFSNSRNKIFVFIAICFLVGVFHEFFIHKEGHSKKSCYLCQILYNGFEELTLSGVPQNFFPPSNLYIIALIRDTKLKSLFFVALYQKRAPPFINFN